VENLVPIGRFSKMTRLSVKTLRRYDDLGLLVPAVVDPSSSYRYYAYSQANQAEAIRILRSLDMPLEEIREVLAADEPELVAKHLERHREHLQERLERHQGMLTFLERLIARKEGVMPYEVQVKKVPAQHVAAVNKHTSIATIGRDIQEGMAAIWAAIAPKGIQVSGPPFLLMHDAIDEETGGDIEVCVPVPEPFAGEDGVYGREVEATTAATTVHRGPYDEVGPAYHMLTGWVQEHGHEIAGPPREVYLTDPQETSDPADYLTEIQFPIR
jgi:effector-binding domain-containing protein